ncbi:MAG: Translation initiation factor IF-1 [Parcubacteria group bacterium GW2011_GWC2_32_10]|nr:MAG: Translation initiation factor IF-1 [Parcubacteria group bacterium GW2011_GWC2_32_10]
METENTNINNTNNSQSSNQQSSQKAIRTEGRVLEALPNAFFKVLLDDKREIMGFLSGKMRLNKITILPGDKVTIEMSPYDKDKGRIVYRLK